MKKLSLIVAMAVILTIGGVFATWTYNDAAVDPVTVNNLGVTINTPSTDSKQATLEASGAPTLRIVNNGAATNDPSQYAAALVIENDIVVTIDISTMAPEATRDGVALEYVVTVEGDDASLFNVTSTPVTLYKTGSDSDVLLDGDTATIAATDLDDLIQLKPITLDTAAKHTTFSNNLKDVKFTIEISVKSGT